MLCRVLRRLAMAKRECKWTVDDDGAFNTECGHRFELTYDGPKENHWVFCPYCGGILKEKAENND